MQILKHPHTDHRPNLRPAAQDPNARVERVEYLSGRYKMPLAKAAELMTQLDMREQVMLEIEMSEKRKNFYRADYDPFGRL